MPLRRASCIVHSTSLACLFRIVFIVAPLCPAGGADVHVSELSSQDAFVGVLGRGSLAMNSLAGSCVLAAGAPGLGGGPLSVQVSGEVGTVVATTQGQPITCTLPVPGECVLHAECAWNDEECQSFFAGDTCTP